MEAIDQTIGIWTARMDDRQSDRQRETERDVMAPIRLQRTSPLSIVFLPSDSISLTTARKKTKIFSSFPNNQQQ